MVETKKVLAEAVRVIPFYFIQPSLNPLDSRRVQARPEKDGAQRVDIAAGRLPAKKNCFEQRGPPPHERIIDEVSWLA